MMIQVMLTAESLSRHSPKRVCMTDRGTLHKSHVRLSRVLSLGLRGSFRLPETPGLLKQGYFMGY